VQLPIIMVSAESDGEVVAGCLSIGANDYVTKPLHWPTLRARMQTHLGVHVGRAMVAAQRAFTVHQQH
jgi:DNA-binding response OmpR family regulator